MPGKNWLIAEGTTLEAAAIRGIERALAPTVPGGRTRGGSLAQLVIRFHDIVIHNNRKWWGGADIRIDVLVVHDNGAAGQAESFYQPTTFRFPRVKDGERLPTDGGLLVFYGRPQHFVDIAITVSRDRKDSADLATLLKNQAGDADVKGSLDALLGLAIAAP
ncbi:MAG: hypothetical protein FJX67_09650 [Alphaproteobacteria bacterium]|nr:hypothetical protein [Alphaproteobacteria bacterium]